MGAFPRKLLTSRTQGPLNSVRHRWVFEQVQGSLSRPHTLWLLRTCMSLASITPVSRIVLRFGFGHLVVDPHYHHDAMVSFKFAGPVVDDPTAIGYGMGADAVAVTRTLETRIRRHLAGRMLFHGACPSADTFTAADKGFVVPPLTLTQCDLPPTIEIVACIIARLCVMSLPDDADPVSIEFLETARTGVTFDGVNHVRAAAAVGAEILAEGLTARDEVGSADRWDLCHLPSGSPVGRPARQAGHYSIPPNLNGHHGTNWPPR